VEISYLSRSSFSHAPAPNAFFDQIAGVALGLAAVLDIAQFDA
jgi:hypothetical protein